MYRRRRPVHCATMSSLSGQISAVSCGTASAKARLSDRSRQPEHAYLNTIRFGRTVQMAACGQRLPPKAQHATSVVFRNLLECGESTFPGCMVSGQDVAVGLKSYLQVFRQCPMWGDFTPSLHRSVRRHRQCAGSDTAPCQDRPPTELRAYWKDSTHKKREANTANEVCSSPEKPTVLHSIPIKSQA